MPNKITIYLGAPGTIGAIELEVFGINDLYPINANIAPNGAGRRVEPGEYIFDSIAYTPKAPEVQATYGAAIIRFGGETGNKLAIFGGETAPDGSLLPTEGSSVRVGNDVLDTIVRYIEGSESETLLIATDDEPGLINSIRSNRWRGQPANTGQIRLLRPARFRGAAVDQTFYEDNDLAGSEITDLLMWALLYSLDDKSATQIDFYRTYDEAWIGYEDSASGGPDIVDSWEQGPEDGGVSSDDIEQLEEAPYIADPFCDTNQLNLTIETQSESSEPGAALDIDDAPDNNY